MEQSLKLLICCIVASLSLLFIFAFTIPLEYCQFGFKYRHVFGFRDNYVSEPKVMDKKLNTEN